MQHTEAKPDLGKSSVIALLPASRRGGNDDCARILISPRDVTPPGRRRTWSPKTSRDSNQQSAFYAPDASAKVSVRRPALRNGRNGSFSRLPDRLYAQAVANAGWPPRANSAG